MPACSIESVVVWWWCAESLVDQDDKVRVAMIRFLTCCANGKPEEVRNYSAISDLPRKNSKIDCHFFQSIHARVLSRLIG